MTITNLEETRSRRESNMYRISYESATPDLPSTEVTTILLETSFWEPSFPTERIAVHSYIGDEGAADPSLLGEDGLLHFDMQVQSLARTLVDKVFAICDYYLRGVTRRYSRHIYDIHMIYPLVKKDESFLTLIEQVGEARSRG